MRRFNMRLKHYAYIALVLLILRITGLWMYLFETDFESKFTYPYEGDFQTSVIQLRMGQTPNLKPINFYNYTFLYNIPSKCRSEEQIRLVYMVKSSADNFRQRTVIRNTWGYEKRFSDVSIKTVFIIGFRSDAGLQERINEESKKYNDIVQGNFYDEYFNNTIKSMMAFKWLVTYCPDSPFYMFVDDDYYVSTKNVLRYLRFPTNYPEYLASGIKDIRYELPGNVHLYSGLVFATYRPVRHIFNKWYITLDEYKYNKWPPYATGGAYILSHNTLLDFYYASFYTAHFRFDDVYIGILAYRMHIAPLNCDYFPVYDDYDRDKFKYVIASHGFKDSDYLANVWNEQKSIGNA